MDLYKNKTGKNIKVRTGNLNNYIWKTIRPEEYIRLPWYIAEPTELTKIEEKEDTDQEKYSEGADNEQTREDQPTPDQFPSKEQYRKNLLAINGVGPKYAQEIIESYPNETVLRQAVEAGMEIHNHDGVDKAVKKTYQ